jgi:hypothetical protein
MFVYWKDMPTFQLMFYIKDLMHEISYHVYSIDDKSFFLLKIIFKFLNLFHFTSWAKFLKFFLLVFITTWSFYRNSFIQNLIVNSIKFKAKFSEFFQSLNPTFYILHVFFPFLCIFFNSFIDFK